MRRWLAVLAVAVSLLIAVPAGAQEEPGNLLDGLSGFDGSLAGSQSFKVLMGGAELGSAEFRLEKAPEGSGAVYFASLEVKIEMGPTALSVIEKALLDEKLALISAESVKKESSPEGATEQRKHVRRVGGGWLCEIKAGEETQTYVTVLKGHNHWGVLCLLALSRRAVAAPAGEYVFQGIEWPDPEEEDSVTEPTTRSVTITTKDPEPVAFGGEEVQARQMRGVQEGDDTFNLSVAVDGRILAFWPDDAPLRIVAVGGETSAPGPVEPAEAAGSAEPKAAVVTYFGVMAGSAEPDALDGIMIWEEIQAWLAVEDPDVGALPVSAFAAVMKAEFAKQAGVISPAAAAMVGAMLIVKVDGDQATVAIPGEEETPFLLRKTSSGWKIYRFPK